jgi:hypothetical protein
MDYPQYRKYHNGRNYFRIISAEEMEEIHFTGEKCFITVLKAKVLPDRNLIYDLTFDFEKMGVEISREEYEAVRNKCA